jgi:hypothetical protein
MSASRSGRTSRSTSVRPDRRIREGRAPRPAFCVSASAGECRRPGATPDPPMDPPPPVHARNGEKPGRPGRSRRRSRVRRRDSGPAAKLRARRRVGCFGPTLRSPIDKGMLAALRIARAATKVDRSCPASRANRLRQRNVRPIRDCPFARASLFSRSSSARSSDG